MSDPRDHDPVDDSDEEDDFNPAPEVGSDAEDNNGDQDESPRRATKRPSPVQSAGGDDDDDDDGENDEDEEGEDVNGGNDDDDEDDEDEEEDEDDEIQVSCD